MVTWVAEDGGTELVAVPGSRFIYGPFCFISGPRDALNLVPTEQKLRQNNTDEIKVPQTME